MTPRQKMIAIKALIRDFDGHNNTVFTTHLIKPEVMLNHIRRIIDGEE